MGVPFMDELQTFNVDQIIDSATNEDTVHLIGIEIWCNVIC